MLLPSMNLTYTYQVLNFISILVAWVTPNNPFKSETLCNSLQHANFLIFLRQGKVRHQSIPKLKNHPLLNVYDCLHSIYSQLEDAMVTRDSPQFVIKIIPCFISINTTQSNMWATEQLQERQYWTNYNKYQYNFFPACVCVHVPTHTHTCAHLYWCRNLRM